MSSPSKSRLLVMSALVVLAGAGVSTPAPSAVIDLRAPGASPPLETLVDGEPSPFFITNRPAPFADLDLDAPSPDAGTPGAGSEDGGGEAPAPERPAPESRRRAGDPEDDTRTRLLEVKLRRAKLHLSMNDLDGAGLICEEILNADPLNADAYVVRGAIQAKRNRHTQALADFDRAIKADPESASAYLSRGMSLLRIGRHDRALDDLDKAISLNPRQSEAYEKRGLVFARQGDFGRAEADFTRAIELDPDSALAFHNRAVARMKLGKEAEARADREASQRLEQARQRP